MTFSLWSSLVFVCLLGAMSPGPSLLVIARHGITNGRSNGLLAAWSHALGVGLYALLTLFGLALILETNPLLYRACQFMGAGYLLWLGVSLLRSKQGLISRVEKSHQCSRIEAIRDGAVISLLNPKLAIFFMALFSHFLPHQDGVLNQIIMVLTPTLIDGIWYSCVVFCLSSANVINRLVQYGPYLDRFCGLLILVLVFFVFI